VSAVTRLMNIWAEWQCVCAVWSDLVCRGCHQSISVSDLHVLPSDWSQPRRTRSHGAPLRSDEMMSVEMWSVVTEAWVGSSDGSATLSVCLKFLSVCPFSKRKTAWAISIKVDRHSPRQALAGNDLEMRRYVYSLICVYLIHSCKNKFWNKKTLKKHVLCCKNIKKA